jgi:type I restriction enzyme S subunit
MTTTINNEHKKLNVPNLRFKEFEGEWEKCKLSEICTFFSGGTPSSSNKDFYGGNIAFIRSGELHADSTELFITQAGFDSSSAKMVEIGDLLLAMYGATSGDIAVSKIKGAINQAILCIRTKQNKKFIESVWNKHVSKNLRKYLQGGQGNLSADIVKGISFFFPTLKEQEKIANLVSLLDERIATQNKIIDKLQSLIKGIRNDVFGKLRKDIGLNAKVGDVLSYEQPQPYIVEDTEYTAGGTPVLTANKAFVLGYTSETDGIYDKGDCIIFDDFTLDCKYVDFPFKVKSSAIKILTAKNKELLRYTFEFLKYLDLSTDEHKRHYIAETQNQEFILPTTQIVRTIAHAFSTLSSRMQTIVKQRDMLELQKQYLLRQMFI